MLAPARVSHAGRVLSLEFAALDYRAPQAARYRLAGFETDWVEVDSQRRLATCTNLDPGVYTFELRAANGEGVWGKETRRLRVTVVPPWWQTWWFTLLADGVVLASVVGGAGLRFAGRSASGAGWRPRAPPAPRPWPPPTPAWSAR